MSGLETPLLQHGMVWLACLAGFTSLAMAMDRHQQAIFHKELPRRATHTARLIGWLCLATALWLAITAQGWSLGLVIYCGHASLAAACLFVALLIRDRRHSNPHGKRH